MTISAYELLARHKEDSGPLRGKVLSDLVLPMPSDPTLVGVMWFRLPDTEGHFKAWCSRPIDLKFRKHQVLPPGVYNAIENECRKSKEARALLLELVYRDGSELYFEIHSPGKVDPKAFGGRAGQFKFDSTHKYRPKVANGCRVRQYMLVATIFDSVKEVVGYITRYYPKYRNQLVGHLQVPPVIPPQTVPVSRTASHDWFTVLKPTWMPKEFVEMLDEDALRLLFPPTFIEKCFKFRKVHKPRVQLTKEVRAAMKAKVREWQLPTDDDAKLVKFYEGLPNAEPLEYQSGYTLNVELHCQLALELRAVPGSKALKGRAGVAS